MRFTLACAALALFGCSSTQTVLNRPVTATYHLTQTVKQVAFCLADKNHTAALERDDGSRVVLLKHGYGGVWLVFSVYPGGEGGRIEYRKEFGAWEDS
jgi:hypothetical protein